jgi:hypothetical protein
VYYTVYFYTVYFSSLPVSRRESESEQGRKRERERERERENLSAQLMKYVSYARITSGDYSLALSLLP